jgi:cardiolipin synthase
VGLRRSDAEPLETRAGQPLHPLTLPNLVGFARIGFLAAFLVLALSSDDGRETAATVCFGVAAVSDYLDGLLARATGQYSRLGALMDPLIDRLLVLSGAIVTWKFELLPRWGLAVLAAREALMIVLVAVALRRGLDIQISWAGRAAVWPTMAGIGLALITDSAIAEVVFFTGLAGALLASVLYVRDGLVALRSPERPSAPA